MRQKGPVQLIGQSKAISDLKAEVERVARSDAKVLITGESGSGKEVVARAINDSSTRAKTFVPVNCAGIPETLLESELFGHVKGSFTGAYRDKPGKLEMADHGTIFLDEIGEMTLRMQGLLLRFLETGEIQKVGAERVVRATDVRVMSATNRNLRELITLGQFREDLFYRINVIHIEVTPLRERREDIPQLIDHFLARFTGSRSLDSKADGFDETGEIPEMEDLASEARDLFESRTGNVSARNFTAPAVPAETGNGIRNTNLAANGLAIGNGSVNGINSHSPVRAISKMAMDALCEYSWPGNVRQVENVVERLVVTGRREIVQLEDLPQEIRNPSGPGRPGRERRRTVADELFKKLVEERESFWNLVYPLYMNREITRANVRDLVHKGLEEARGNYKIVLRLFNMDATDYKRFLNFLRKHDCQLPFKEYR
ncbi:MAG TPA: sigma-54 dependent transcriptional regulator [Vicinamibacterales bacterium]|nr:sigma-54 dependent transcriptional regulator [Vicinamibacterales bacterium]